MKPEWQSDADTESKELRRDRDRRYREINPQVGYERLKRWRKLHPENARELQRKSEQNYKDNNPTKASRTTEWRKTLSDEEAEARREKERLRKREERARKKALEPPKPPKTPTPAHASIYPDPSAGYAEAVAETSVQAGVVILHGQSVDFNTAWGFADADLRERIITQLPSATDQELLDAYCLLHEERYGEPFDF